MFGIKFVKMSLRYPASITYLCHEYLIINYVCIKNIVRFNGYWNFLAPDIGTGIGSKDPTSVRPMDVLRWPHPAFMPKKFSGFHVHYLIMRPTEYVESNSPRQPRPQVLTLPTDFTSW